MSAIVGATHTVRIHFKTSYTLSGHFIIIPSSSLITFVNHDKQANKESDPDQSHQERNHKHQKHLFFRLHPIEALDNSVNLFSEKLVGVF